ncbi:MAG TPA: hydrogenase nickel incorporation protein HypA [Gammaproteobacteria bacterium]|nr:hydrogenase nickel incorporation protein HypA [Gammaproteobacteria bacterium]
MHEMSLIADLMRKIDQVAQQENAERVVSVQVWLGALSHISADHFREHFVEGARGSLAEDAQIKVTESQDVDHQNAQDILLKGIEVV